jgi:hypothetical protein
MNAITHQPIPSSEFRHIDRTDDEPIAHCAICRVRLAFQHYYDVPVCFCCQYNLSNMAPYDLLQGTSIALSLATHEKGA